MAVQTAIVERMRRRQAWRKRRRAGITPYDDELLKWLTFANAGMLHPGQLHLLDLAVRLLPGDEPVVEIGSFCGLSTNVISHLLAKHGRENPFFAVDPLVFDGEAEADGAVDFEGYRRLVGEQFERNVRFWSGDRLPQTHRLTSDEFFDAWAARERRTDAFGREVELGGPLAFCFVDGAHTYEQARRDFENTDRFLVSGGLVLFDDSDELGGFPDVYRVVRETLDGGRYELVGANPHHLLRKR